MLDSLPLTIFEVLCNIMPFNLSASYGDSSFYNNNKESTLSSSLLNFYFYSNCSFLSGYDLGSLSKICSDSKITSHLLLFFVTLFFTIFILSFLFSSLCTREADLFLDSNVLDEYTYSISSFLD